MKHLPFNFLRSTLFLVLTLYLSACSSFPKAVRLVERNEIEKAEVLFERAQKHKIYGPGARYYLEQIKVNRKPNTLSWIDISQAFCVLEEEVGRLPSAHPAYGRAPPGSALSRDRSGRWHSHRVGLAAAGRVEFPTHCSHWSE